MQKEGFLLNLCDKVTCSVNENTDLAPYKNSKYQESNFKRNKNFNKGKENAISEIKKGF